MDPISVTAAVVSLTAKCMQTAKLLHELKSSYTQAQTTIVAITSETTIISVSLSRLQALMLENTDALSIVLNTKSEVANAFDTVLTGCMVVYTALEEEVLQLVPESSPIQRLGLWKKVKIMWNEDEMQRLLAQIRSQQVAMSHLIQLLQLESTADMRIELMRNSELLRQIASQTKHLRSVKPILRSVPSIYEMQFDTRSVREGDAASSSATTTFEFDHIIINSLVYQRAMDAEKQDCGKFYQSLPQPEVSGIQTDKRETTDDTVSLEHGEVDITRDDVSEISAETRLLRPVASLRNDYELLLAKYGRLQSNTNKLYEEVMDVYREFLVLEAQQLQGRHVLEWIELFKRLGNMRVPHSLG